MIEFGEIYAKEEAQLAPAMPLLDMDAGLFDGSLTTIPQGIKHVVDVAASATANAAMPVLEKVTPDSMTEWLDEQRRVANESMKATRTDPRTVGTVGQMLHGVSSVLTGGVIGGLTLGPIGAVGAIAGSTMFDKATELMDQGVDLGTAQKVGAVTGTVMGAGAALPPFLGGTLGKQIASGIGINIGLGVAERAGSAAILEDKYAGIAQHYNALDGTAIAIDAVLGAAFPLGARALRRTVAQIDDAMDANRVVAEQSRDPALQATLEGIDRKLAVDMEVTRQIMEEGRPLGDIEIPANAMDDTVPNRAVGEAAAAAAKAIDDLMVQESGRGMGAVEADIAAMARAFNPERVEPEIKTPDADKTTPPPPDIESEVSPDQFTKQAAQSIIDTDPNLKVVDENGKEMVAKDLLDQAEVRFKQEKQEAALFKVAVACAIGVGE